MTPLRSVPQASPYDQRPVTTSLMRRLDNGVASAYPSPVAQNVGQPAQDQEAWMMAMERRLGTDKKKDQDITGKKSNGSAKPDYITPRSV